MRTLTACLLAADPARRRAVFAGVASQDQRLREQGTRPTTGGAQRRGWQRDAEVPPPPIAERTRAFPQTLSCGRVTHPARCQGPSVLDPHRKCLTAAATRLADSDQSGRRRTAAGDGRRPAIRGGGCSAYAAFVHAARSAIRHLTAGPARCGGGGGGQLQSAARRHRRAQRHPRRARGGITS